MAALTVREILAQLRVLGIENISDIGVYLNDYKRYCMENKYYTEKRASARIPAGETVRIACDNKFYTGTILNVSENGMFIGTRKTFPHNAVIYVENELLKVLARVKRTTEMNGYYDGIGVELSKADRSYFEFISNLKPSK